MIGTHFPRYLARRWRKYVEEPIEAQMHAREREEQDRLKQEIKVSKRATKEIHKILEGKYGGK